ncbi:ATP-binding cassette domain-containing protein [Microbacterium sp. KSW2-21]|uniref:ATP-binding cassette domain-containing protein n=1 Tax=Microbacterium algihabitans TaxID=3075992 RepID=A0ABU3RVK0_9MICO|nr:ATP-binding cassette domain-containing protein [Microbacterium sp. KSW2-21]MDU0326839.1 ATP-binding cassette domain-containing protein [Microbacterium sp. KSW2-21]
MVAADETPADVAVEGPAVVADETPADVAVEEPAVAANETPADVAAGEPAVAADTTPADVPAGEPAVAAPIAVDPTSAGIAADEPAAEAVADPTPADVAVEEPIVDPSQADASDAVVVDETPAQPVADTTVEDPAAEPEILVATPLEDETDSAVAEPVDVAESEDPTPADVRVDEEAPAPADDEPTDDTRTAVLDAADAPEPAAADEPADDTRTALLAPASVDDSAAEHTDDDQRDNERDADDAPVDRDDATAVLAAATAESANDDSAVAVTDTDESEVAASATDDPAVAVIAADDTVVTASATEGADPETAVPALTLRNVSKSFGELKAVDAIDLTVPAGSFYGLVGPNGAGKTTTLSIIAGLLRPDGGAVSINGVDATKRSREAKKLIGVLPDRLRTFDRLTGRQLLSYYGALRGLPASLVESRTADLARAFDLVDALARPVSDYSAGMTKKVMLAGAMIHSPRLLVLDEPFEAVDPVSSGVILDILGAYVEHGGTVILSSHGMELVERVCSRVAVIVSGQMLAEGTVDEVRGEGTLEQRFRELSGGLGDVEGLEWLHTFSA